MGMYDVLRVQLVLPGNQQITDETFQTKHFGGQFDTYVIKENGEIYQKITHCEIVDDKLVQSEEGSARLYLTNLNERVTFYNDKCDYHAKFINGRVHDIVVEKWNTHTEAL